MDSVKSFRLSSEESQRIFQASIVPTEFPEIITQESPTVVFIGGQPGAGKTGLQAAVESLNNLPSLIKINGDDFRPYHPDSKLLMLEDDTRAAFYTDVDVGKWVEMAIEYVKGGRPNALIEGTLRNPGVTISSAESFLDCGYKAEMHVIAAHEFHSKLRIFNRYLFQREVQGYGRYTLMDAHDASYNVLVESLMTLITTNTFNRIVLYTVEREVLFDSHTFTGDIAITAGDLLRYVHSSFHGSIEKLLVDINAAYRKAESLNCNTLVLGDIKKLSDKVLGSISKNS
jgi:hypothetical protein